MGLSPQSAKVASYRVINQYDSVEVANRYFEDLCRPPQIISTLMEILDDAEAEVERARRSLRRSYQRRKNS